MSFYIHLGYNSLLLYIGGGEGRVGLVSFYIHLGYNSLLLYTGGGGGREGGVGGALLISKVDIMKAPLVISVL